MSQSMQFVEPVMFNSCLSGELRARTAMLHSRVEHVLGLPSAIGSTNCYASYLARFLGLYEPLEAQLASFSNWANQSLALRPQTQSALICADLAALGRDPGAAARTPFRLLPKLPTFSHAVGALYVIEGARLGGRVILRDLDTRLGADIAGARSFFGGGGGARLADWGSVKAALDDFGKGRPEAREQAAQGAKRTFESMLLWFGPLAAARRRRS